MIDQNINSKPFENGDKVFLEIEILDADKAYDFIGQALFNKIDISHLGFNIDKLSLSKDKYIDNLELELRSEIKEKLNKAIDDISDLLNIY